MTNSTLLHPGDRFPALTVALPGGGARRLPDDLAGCFGVILFYQGSWCPYCNAQLRAFQRSRLNGTGGLLVALSVDDEATTPRAGRQARLAVPHRPQRRCQRRRGRHQRR